MTALSYILVAWRNWAKIKQFIALARELIDAFKAVNPGKTPPTMSQALDIAAKVGTVIPAAKPVREWTKAEWQVYWDKGSGPL